jgi:hypothetical protein
MKLILAFFFFFLANCLVPSTIGATVNSKNSLSTSTPTLKRKLDFKQRLRLKTSKNSFINGGNKEWIYSLLLIIIGLLLSSTSVPLQDSAKASIGVIVKPLIWIAALVVAVLGFFTFLVGLLKLMEYLRIKRENQ